MLDMCCVLGLIDGVTAKFHLMYIRFVAATCFPSQAMTMRCMLRFILPLETMQSRKYLHELSLKAQRTSSPIVYVLVE